MARRDMGMRMQSSNSSGEEVEVLSVEPISAIVPSKETNKGKAKVVGVVKKNAAPRPSGGAKLLGASIRASAAEAAKRGGAQAARGGAAGPAPRLSALEALGSTAEREAWLLDSLPVAVTKGAKEMGPVELRWQMATSLLQMMETGVGVLGMLEKEEELQERENSVLRLEKEVEALKKSQRRLQADLAEEKERQGVAEARVRTLEGQGLELVNKIRDLEDDSREAEEKMRELKEVRDFWAEEGAELIMKKCLDSNTFFEWFLSYSKLVRKVGYCAGVERVFEQCKDRLGSYRIVEIKGYKILDAAIGTLINDAYLRLQSGEIRFPILEALASNPGLNVEQLRKIEELAEPGLGGPGTAGGGSASAEDKRPASGPPSGSEASKKLKSAPSGVPGSAGSSTPVEEVEEVEEVEQARDEGLTREEKETLVERVEGPAGTENAPEAEEDPLPEGAENEDEAGAEKP